MTITNVVVMGTVDMVEGTMDVTEVMVEIVATNQEAFTRIDSTMFNHRNVFKQGTFLWLKESQSLTTSNQKSFMDSQSLIPQLIKLFPPQAKLNCTQLVTKHRDITLCRH